MLDPVIAPSLSTLRMARCSDAITNAVREESYAAIGQQHDISIHTPLMRRFL